MRICYFSDLHLEHYNYEQKFPEADTLLLAGDICHAVDLVNYRNNPDRIKRRDHTLWFFDEVLERFQHVLYSIGNHEHFEFDFHETCQAINHALPTELILLDKKHVEIEGIIFYGATLWTDFNNSNPDDMAAASLKMPEYRYATAGDSLLTPEITIRDHKLALERLSDIANTSRNKPVIAVTHHSPSLLGLNTTIHNPALQNAFASDLHDFIQKHNNIKHWIFGHTHIQKEFKVEQCHLAANCRGYSDLEQIAYLFSPEKFFKFSAENGVAA